MAGNDIQITIGANDRASKVLKTVGASVTQFVAVVGSATAAFAKMRQEMNRVDEIQKTARELGILSRDLVGLTLAADEFAGVTESQLRTALEAFSRRLGEAAEGTGEAATRLEDWGLSARRLQQLGLAQSFNIVADRIAGLGTATEKAASAADLFGRSGVQLVNVLNEGSAGLEKMTRRADELGLTFTELEGVQIEMANDAITELTASVSGLARTAAVQLAPAIRLVSDALTDLFNRRAGELSMLDKIRAGYTMAAARFVELVGSGELAPVLGADVTGAQLIGLEKALDLQGMQNAAAKVHLQTMNQQIDAQRLLNRTTEENPYFRVPPSRSKIDELNRQQFLDAFKTQPFFGLGNLFRNLPMEMLRRLGMRGTAQQNIAMPTLAASQSRLMTGGGRQDPIVTEIKEQKADQRQFTQWVQNTLWPGLQRLLEPEEDQLEVKVVRR